MTPEPDKIVGGKYRLERPLAKGGMGAVWVARHTELDSPVAVKLMAYELVGTPVAEARFKREAKAAAQLRSPHVVQIHDYGVQEDAPYMVMELLDGEDLSTELERKGRLSVGRVSTILSQVAKALSLAHAAGIVHRDLKPSNLFLARSGDDETVKVLDFGVAKETMPSLVVDKTTSGTLVGSPQYMSPEQARGEPVDFASDLWSLGVVIFEALTGRPPFVSTHLGALLAKIHEAAADTPTSIAPDLPPAIDAFMKRALARNPADRFRSAKAMAEELAAIAAADAHPGAPRTVTIVVAGAVAAGSIMGRAVDTLPAADPAPVSTTMAGPRTATPNGRVAPPRRMLVPAVVAGSLAALATIAWLGLSRSQNPGASGASDPGEPGHAASASLVTSKPKALPAGPTAQASVTGGGTPSAKTAHPASSTPPRATTSPTATAKAPASAAPTAKPAVSSKPGLTATPTAAPTPTAFDPLFGLPSKIT
jgi:hypothetical protein